MSRFVVVLLACILATGAAEARIQGAKGRRLEVYSSLVPYQGGLLVLKPVTMESTFLTDMGSQARYRPVDAAMIQRYADQFLATRLREIKGLRLRLNMPGSVPDDRAILVAAAHVVHQDEHGRRRGKVFMVVDLTDGRTGELVASFMGYGTGRKRKELEARRDDMQEITRVFGYQLAKALELRPAYVYGYEPRPYVRRPVSLAPHPGMRQDRAESSSGPLPKER